MVCVDGEATATLSPLASPGGTKMLVSKTSASTAYVAEVRTPAGVDAGMCHPGGVLVYEVDANAASGGPVDDGPISTSRTTGFSPDLSTRLSFMCMSNTRPL